MSYRQKGLNMTKSTSKKAAAPAKRSIRSASNAPPATPASASSGSQPLVAKQPQSKQQAAISNGMFLYTNDAWSQAYFNTNDLHFLERELFG